MFDEFKREALRKLRAAEDKSPKGSIDEPIVDLIELINTHPNYVRGFVNVGVFPRDSHRLRVCVCFQ